jgi:TonB family protein
MEDHPASGDLKRPVVVSAAAHLILVAALLVSLPHAQRGEAWGGTGGSAIQVALVGRLPGVPLPRPPVLTQSRSASESPGLHKTLPKPAPKPTRKTTPAPPERAQALPRFGHEKPVASARPPQERESRTPPQPLGAIPYGEGGPAALPYSSFEVGESVGGMSFEGGGAFASRYTWYVESVQRRVSSNWLQATIDPYVQWAPRLVVTFEILRDGTVVNTQILRSSGVVSVDRSAVRAIRDSSPLDRLPSDYDKNKVLVEFWFEFRRP